MRFTETRSESSVGETFDSLVDSVIMDSSRGFGKGRGQTTQIVRNDSGEEKVYLANLVQPTVRPNQNKGSGLRLFGIRRQSVMITGSSLIGQFRRNAAPTPAF